MLPRNCHNHEAQLSWGTKRMRVKEQTIIKQTPHKKQEAHGPQHAHLSETATADMQICRWHATFFQYCQILKLMTRQWLKQFLRYLAYKVKCWNFPNAISQIFFRCHLVHLLILSFKGFFSIFSSGNHFVQQSRTILAILAKEHKRYSDVKLFWNLVTGHGDVV